MVKIKDIALKAGVSSATVSRILNMDATFSVREQTRQRVLTLAKEMGYLRDGQKVKSGNRVGLVQWISSFDEIEDPYYYALRTSVENFLLQEGVEVRRFYKENLGSLFDDKQLSGLICMGKFSLHQARAFQDKFSNLIFVDASPNDRSFHSVVPNLVQATKDLLDHLAQKGHRSIGFIGGQEMIDGQPLEDIRWHTYNELIDQDDRFEKTPSKYRMMGQFNALTGYQKLKEVLFDKACPSAFICASDTIAMGALRALDENKHRIKPISIVGYNDITTAKYFNPPLTTIHIDTKEMGEVAGQMMLHLLSHSLSFPLKIEMQLSLVERGSVYELG